MQVNIDYHLLTSNFLMIIKKDRFNLVLYIILTLTLMCLLYIILLAFYNAQSTLVFELFPSFKLWHLLLIQKQRLLGNHVDCCTWVTHLLYFLNSIHFDLEPMKFLKQLNTILQICCAIALDCKIILFCIPQIFILLKAAFHSKNKMVCSLSLSV